MYVLERLIRNGSISLQDFNLGVLAEFKDGDFTKLILDNLESNLFTLVLLSLSFNTLPIPSLSLY